ncbi:hypothetical protein ARMSODRAFT_774964 [Armillaria solidipes]|uniref:Uncharacterized protein n=1 Tax=Armillaria solidipes TaxID=1076256 RepID=A0A2H3AXW5_9AGAR|nr:hypothetical protein ARMSODRAFT_774964 [Armillaria solidipes]
MVPFGRHSSERSISQKKGLDKYSSFLSFHAFVYSVLPLDNGFYHSTRLLFVPITALDSSSHREEFCLEDHEDMYNDEY